MNKDEIKINYRDFKERLEEFWESDKKSATTIKILLAMIALPGLMSVALVIPNLFSVFGSISKNSQKYKRYGNRFRVAVHEAKKKRYITTKRKNSNDCFVLTEEGKNVLYFDLLKNLSIKPQKKWDKKWRVIVFDIPNECSFAREFLRAKIKQLGCQKLQKSVYIVPWPCLREVEAMREAFQIEEYVTLLQVDLIEDANTWKKRFHLMN